MSENRQPIFVETVTIMLEDYERLNKIASEVRDALKDEAKFVVFSPTFEDSHWSGRVWAYYVSKRDDFLVKLIEDRDRLKVGIQESLYEIPKDKGLDSVRARLNQLLRP